MITVPIYLVIAYGVFWLLPFGLILSIWVRQQRIEREIRALEAQVAERFPDETD